MAKHVEIDFDDRELERIKNGADMRREILNRAEKVRRKAVINAHPIFTKRPALQSLWLRDALAVESGKDENGDIYADVGYTKKHEGFVLWWHEVGIRKFRGRPWSPTPHLRPALREVMGED